MSKKIHYRALFIIVLSSYFSLYAFKSLSEAQKSAKALSKGKQVTFIAEQFKKLLSLVTIQRENIGYTGRFVTKITPYPSSHYYVWGPLKGAFMSLIRSLEYLKQQGIIADDFTLQKPLVSLIFNGDLIKESETSLETLSLILALMHANPQQVIYLKGEIENNLHWQNNGLKKSLRSKLRHISSERIPLGRQITRFFDTLPLALYLTGQDPSKGSIRISYFARDYNEIDENDCGAALTRKTVNVPQICYLAYPQKGRARVNVLIKSEQRLMSYSYHSGLSLVEPDRGAVTWSIFSGPTKSYQKNYHFYFDAFALIQTEKTINDATITLYNRDIRTKKPLRPAGTYNLLTGIEIPTKGPASKTMPKRATVQHELRQLYQQIDQLMSMVTSLATAVTEIKKEKP